MVPWVRLTTCVRTCRSIRLKRSFLGVNTHSLSTFRQTPAQTFLLIDLLRSTSIPSAFKVIHSKRAKWITYLQPSYTVCNERGMRHVTQNRRGLTKEQAQNYCRREDVCLLRQRVEKRQLYTMLTSVRSLCRSVGRSSVHDIFTSAELAVPLLWVRVIPRCIDWWFCLRLTGGQTDALQLRQLVRWYKLVRATPEIGDEIVSSERASDTQCTKEPLAAKWERDLHHARQLYRDRQTDRRTDRQTEIYRSCCSPSGSRILASIGQQLRCWLLRLNYAAVRHCGWLIVPKVKAQMIIIMAAGWGI